MEKRACWRRMGGTEGGRWMGIAGIIKDGWCVSGENRQFPSDPPWSRALVPSGPTTCRPIKKSKSLRTQALHVQEPDENSKSLILFG